MNLKQCLYCGANVKLKSNSEISYCEYCGNEFLLDNININNSEKNSKNKYSSLINNKRNELDKKNQLDSKSYKEIDDEIIDQLIRYNSMSDKEKEEFDKSID